MQMQFEMRPYNLRQTVFLIFSERLRSVETRYVKINSLKKTLTRKPRRRLLMLFLLSKSSAWRKILTAMDIVAIPRVEMAMRSITDSSRRRPYSIVQKSDQRDFTGNSESTPLISASGRKDFKADQDRNDETRDVLIFEDGDFPALRPNDDRNEHAHHRYTVFLWIHETSKLGLRKKLQDITGK